MTQPERIGKYELTKFLGGGMSHVYKAMDRMIGRTVAVKILTDAGAADHETRARFIREAQTAGNVMHDNIIRVYDFGEEGGRLFMVMEFLEGEDLNDAIRNGHTGGILERLSTAVQITRAMEHIHGLGIIHRDLKPHNVYMTRQGIAKLMDFGIAKTADTSMTKTGFTLGTPSYMAPEQVMGKQVNHLSDIYAFGIVLFELMTGAKPFGGDSIERVFWQILNQPPDLGPLRQSGVPERVQALIQRCTAKDPAVRPQNFSEVRRELEIAIEEAKPRPTVAAKVPQDYPTRALETQVPAQQSQGPPKWLVPAGAGLGVVIAILAGVLLFRSPKPAPVVTRTETTTATSAPPNSGDSSTPVPVGMALVEHGTTPLGPNGTPTTLPDFYIDRTKVSNRDYLKFVNETGHAGPAGLYQANQDDPVVLVNLEDARAYAHWAGKRLPSDVEWEKAARAGLLSDLDEKYWELLDVPISPSARAVENMKKFIPNVSANEPWTQMRNKKQIDDGASIPARFSSTDLSFRCARSK